MDPHVGQLGGHASGEAVVVGLIVAGPVAGGVDRRQLVKGELTVSYRVGAVPIGAQHRLVTVGFAGDFSDREAPPGEGHETGGRSPEEETPAEGLADVAGLVEIPA